MQLWIILALVTLFNIFDANANTNERPIHDLTKCEETNHDIFDNYNDNAIVGRNDFNDMFDIAEKTNDNSEGVVNQNYRIYWAADVLNNAEHQITKETVPKYIYRGHKNKKMCSHYKLKQPSHPNPVVGLIYFETFDRLPSTEYTKPQEVFQIKLFYLAKNLKKYTMEENERKDNYNLYMKSILLGGKRKKNQLVNMKKRLLFDMAVRRDIDEGDILKVVERKANKINSRRLPMIGDFKDNLDFSDSLGTYHTESTPELHQHDVKSSKNPIVQKRIFSIFSKWKQFSPVNREIKLRRPSYVYRHYPGVSSEDRNFVIAETRGSMRAPGSPLRWG